MFSKYNVSTYAILVDHTSVLQDLPVIPESSPCGLYTFDMHLAGKGVMGQQIKLLRLDGIKPMCDGWLVHSTSRAAAFSLTQALKLTGNEDQIIIRYYGGQTTLISAYMDMFSGETETMIYINHYFDRKYRICFPIDIRYTACRCDGTIVRSGQRIISPGGLTVLDSRDMNLGNFEGYMRVEMEVENLQTRVQPFIHFWADYISDAGICRNHQSGWSPHPPDTVFNRGYLPLDPSLESIVSIYNDNECPIQVKALLHYNEGGLEKKVVRYLTPVPAKQMSYQSLTELFSDISFDSTVNAAYTVLTCDKPLHRPNNYIAVRGHRQFVDSYHQTAGKACYMSIPSYQYEKKDIESFMKAEMTSPWTIHLPVLNSRYDIETFFGLLSLTICDQSVFHLSILDYRGITVFSEEVHLDGTSRHFTNICAYAQQRSIDLSRGGTFCISPSRSNSSVPRGSCVLFGLKHKSFSHISTSFRGGPTDNLPFYINARSPMSREYDYSPFQVSDHFAPGIVSDSYDTLIIVTNMSVLRNYNTAADYQLEVIDSSGTMYSFHRSIAPNTHDSFLLSEVLSGIDVDDTRQYFTIWIKHYGLKLKPYHLLYRKTDHALSFDDASEGTLQKEPQIEGIDTRNKGLSPDVITLFGKETGEQIQS